ncbi:SufD family Fe-S cluster assembly protein [bacterium]|nr:SufD family Fe-S cluster assembly protein [bacterium]
MKLSKSDIQKLQRVGYDSTGDIPRAGTFLTKDHEILSSERKDAGLEILPLKVALEKYSWVENLAFGLVPDEKDNYTKQIASHPPVGYFIRAFPGAKITQPVQSCFFIKTNRFSQMIHNIIVVEPNSELHIITGCTTAAYIKQGSHIGVTEFYIGENAKLSYTMIHDWAPQVQVFPRSAALLEASGTFISNYIALTAAELVQAYPMATVKKNGIARFNSIIYAPQGSHFDIGAGAKLVEPEAKAEIISRAVSSGGQIIARGYLEGSAANTRGHMECNGLLLRDEGFIHAVPELKGNFSQTDLSHEAAVGKIADEEIHYLMTRGLDEDTATSLIVRGFLDVRLKGLPPQLQKDIDVMIEKASLKSTM